MITNKLSKQVKLYRNQFEKFMADIFGDHRLERLSIELDGMMFRLKYMTKNNLDLDKIPSIRDEFSKKALMMRECFSEFTYNFICQVITIPAPFKADDIIDILTQDVKINPSYVSFTMDVISDNIDFLNYIDSKLPDNEPFNMFPDEFFRFYTDSYNDGISKAFPELFETKEQHEVGSGDDASVFTHSLTLQVGERCSLGCTYCLSGDALIHTSLGYPRRIRDLKKGDRVVGFDENIFKHINEKGVVKEANYDVEVLDVYKRKAVVYQFKSPYVRGVLHITPEHKVLTDKGWIMVQNLKPDIKVGIRDGHDIMFTSNYQVTKDDSERDVYNIATESGTYIANGLCVHNCYQFAKSEMRMSFDTARTFIDHLLNDDYGYLNRYNSPALIMEFIGGEPLLEIKLIRQIYEYFLSECYRLNHPWFLLHRLSICSNGMQYFDKEVQSFFKDYSSQISFNISIDGNKELHDSCRIQPNGEGSYDIDITALNHYNKHFNPERNSKMTLAPSNIKYLFESVKDFIDHDMNIINLNCVFEEGWTATHATEEYYQLKQLSDYIIENDLEHIYLSIFNERQEGPYDKTHDGNSCFAAGTNVLTQDGNDNIENLRIGDIIYTASGSKHIVTKMTKKLSTDNVIIRATGTFPIHCTSDHKVFAKKFLYVGWKGVWHYSEPGFYPVSELKVGDRVALPMLNIANNKPNFITKKMAYLLGVFIADGFVSSSNRYTIHITPGYDTDHYYLNILQEAGLIVHVYNKPTSMDYVMYCGSSEANKVFFKLCQGCGHLAHNKHFPRIIFESPEEIIRECIRGYCDTNGYTVENSTSSKTTNGLVKINTVSRRLANDLMILLRSIGEFPTCYLYKRAGQMTIEGRVVNVRDIYEVYYKPNARNVSGMFKYDDTYNILWTGIRSIEVDRNEQYVYCPTVANIYDGLPSEHTFIADTLAVQNCGGDCSMLAVRPNGQFYPCIRYMPTSVGHDVRDLCLGDVSSGLKGREEGSEIIQMFDNITRRSSTTDICWECPISNSCMECMALRHTVFGTPENRTTFACIMNIAEALANVYYWNLLITKHPEYNLEPRRNVVPDEWALLIIDKDELDLLKLLEASALLTKFEQ